MPTPIREKILNEGAEIYFERRGNGPILLLVHGGMEDAGYYSSAADILADKFTVVSYDRRCNSRSSGDRSVDMRVTQQARDAASIINAVGDGKALVVGRSGGAIIGLELAATMPEMINFVIVHEAPVIELLPKSDAEKWRSFVYNIYLKSQREGSLAAQTEFMASLISVPDSPFPTDLNDRLSGNTNITISTNIPTNTDITTNTNITNITSSSITCITRTNGRILYYRLLLTGWADIVIIVNDMTSVC